MHANNGCPLKVGDVVAPVEYEGTIPAGLQRLYREDGQLVISEVRKTGGRWFVQVHGRKNIYFVERFVLMEERKVEMEDTIIVTLKSFKEMPLGDDNPGWFGCEEHVGKQVVARELKEGEAFFGKALFRLEESGLFWPMAYTEAVKDDKLVKKLIKAAAKKAKKVAKKKPAKKFLRTELRKQVGINPGTCSYGLQYETGGLKMHIRDVCHARMYSGGQKLKAVALHVKSHYDASLEKKAYVQFMNYLFNRSPLAIAFKTKKASEALSREVAMNIDATQSQVATAACALRQASEYKGFLPAFRKVRELGGSEHAAFFIANTHTFVNDVWTRHWSGGHQIMYSEMNYEEVIKRFKTGALPVNDGPFRTQSNGYKFFKTFDPNCREYGEDGKTNPQKKIVAVFNATAPEDMIGDGWNKARRLTDKHIIKLAKKIDADIKQLFAAA